MSTRLPRDSGRRRPRPRGVREVGLIWTHRLRAEGRRAVCENADSTACSSQIQTAGPGTCYPTTSCTLLSRARAVYCRLSEAKNGHPPCADTLPVLRWDVRAAHEGEHGTRAGAHSPAYPVDGFESRHTTSRSPRCGLQCDPFAAIPTTNPTCPSFRSLPSSRSSVGAAAATSAKTAEPCSSARVSRGALAAKAGSCGLTAERFSLGLVRGYQRT